eukprot:3299449-Amphidinium_carterae.1
MHAYDVHYGTVRRDQDSWHCSNSADPLNAVLGERSQDVIVALDDSIVRGNTLKNAILHTLDRLGCSPQQPHVCTSRDPATKQIEQLRHLVCQSWEVLWCLTHVSMDIRCAYIEAEAHHLRVPLNERPIVNYVKRIYEQFTPEEVSQKICKLLKPSDCKAELDILYGSIEALHEALPNHA